VLLELKVHKVLRVVLVFKALKVLLELKVHRVQLAQQDHKVFKVYREQLVLLEHKGQEGLKALKELHQLAQQDHKVFKERKALLVFKAGREFRDRLVYKGLLQQE
jgi:stress response protein YsnF